MSSTRGGLPGEGAPQLDAYLDFLGARSRPNAVLAVAYDLKPMRGRMTSTLSAMSRQSMSARDLEYLVDLGPDTASTPKLAQMKLLVTGAAGFLGRHVCRHAVAAGMTVVGTYRSAPASINGVEWVSLDVTDPVAVDGLMTSSRPDAIVHTAIAFAGPSHRLRPR